MSEESDPSTENTVLERSVGYLFPKSLVINDDGEHPMTPYEIPFDDCRPLCKLMQDQINRLVYEMPARNTSAKAVIVRYEPHPELKISFLDRSQPNAKTTGWPSFITPRSLEEMHEMAGELASAFKDERIWPSPETFLCGQVTHSRISQWGHWIDSLRDALGYLTFQTKHSNTYGLG